MKIFEESHVINGKIETKAAAPLPAPKSSSGSAWVDQVYGTPDERRPKLWERADAVAVHDITGIPKP